MANSLKITYNGDTIHEATSSETCALNTEGTFLTDDITVEVEFDESADGIDTSDATATANDILYPKTAYVNGVKVTGAVPTYDGSGVVIIEFTITAGDLSTTCQAEEGMTWAEWTESEYSDGIEVSISNGVCHITLGVYSLDFSPSQTIVANSTYVAIR